MNLILEYRPYGIAVTDLSSQLWCEKQLEFSLEKGRVKTEEMKKGGERHQDLHEEIAVLIKVQPQSLEDHVALRLHNSLVGLTRLLTQGMTREVSVFGKVNSLFVTGSIDEITLKNRVLKILDTKTRKSNSMPTEAQKRTTRFQLMSYKHLFESIREGKFTTANLLSSYNFDKKSKITNEFRKQIKSLGDEIEPKILKLSDHVFSLVQELPATSNEFEIRYENQLSKKVIGVDKFQFDPEEFKKNCDFVEEFWLGKRSAIPVSEANRWKCDHCEFKQICQNRVKTLDNFQSNRSAPS
jgi:exonuclease V